LACPLCRAERSADFGGRLVGFGDDLAVKADGFLVADPGPAWMLSRLGAGRPLLERARLGVAFVGAVRRGSVIDPMSHWLAADGLARRLGLGDDVRRSLRDGYERWDGKGAIGARGKRSVGRAAGGAAA
jgi:hypothetical protein